MQEYWTVLVDTFPNEQMQLPRYVQGIASPIIGETLDTTTPTTLQFFVTYLKMEQVFYLNVLFGETNKKYILKQVLHVIQETNASTTPKTGLRPQNVYRLQVNPFRIN